MSFLKTLGFRARFEPAAPQGPTIVVRFHSGFKQGKRGCFRAYLQSKPDDFEEGLSRDEALNKLRNRFCLHGHCPIISE